MSNVEKRHESVKFNTDETIIFLEKWQENGGFVQLTAINPDPPKGKTEITTRCFALPDEAEATETWINEYQGRWNLYFAVNPLKARQNKKAKKGDVDRLAWLHVDIDPEDGKNIHTERERILASLIAVRPAPTVIIDSGGGYQGFWKLDNPVKALDQAHVVELEGSNKRLELELGGDHCHNIERIMRLPGTINMPNQKKRDKGRTPSPAKLIAFNDETHEPADFTHLPLPLAVTVPVLTGVHETRTIEAFKTYIDKNPHSRLGKLWAGGPGNDRSKFDFALATLMVRQDIADGDIAAVLCSYTGSKAAERGEAYLSLTINKARANVAAVKIAVIPGSEDGIALEFIQQHGENLAYVKAWDRWLEWTGHKWVKENTGKIYDMVRTTCRNAEKKLAAESGKGKRQLALLKNAAVAGSHRLAQGDRQVARAPDIFDAEPWLLNTPGFIHDLYDEKDFPNAPEYHMTKSAAVASKNGPAPRWMKFLDEVTGGDKELQAFLQRMAGYCLTGSTREHALFFLYGTGANGKNVFMETISGILGDYAKTTPLSTFMETKHEAHLTELANLQGARLIFVDETKKGQKWDQSRLSMLTGGKSISARFMRQDLFEFTPQFKLIFAGNHKPGLQGVEEAWRRRFNLIPFTVTIPKAQRDVDLSYKLQDEWPQILTWILEGCKEWRRIGLAPPAAVTDATEEYMGEEDPVAQWVEDCCVTGVNKRDTVANLFTSWRRWCEANNEPLGSKKALGQELLRLRYKSAKSGAVRLWNGLRVFDAKLDI